MNSGGLVRRLSACTLCTDRFAVTATAHRPNPVVWFRDSGPLARLLIVGQAPGARVHASGRPFSDASGDRLRDWLGIGPDVFYDRDLVAIAPMAFCFPGYDAKGADLPPPAVCARTWRAQVIEAIGPVPLMVLVGGAAQGWHLGKGMAVAERVRRWRDHWPGAIPLPHPSWRNTGWLKRNPWFGEEVLPALRARVQEVLS